MNAPAAAAPPPLIELRGVTKIYGTGQAAVQALRGIDLVHQPGRVRRDHGAERLAASRPR